MMLPREHMAQPTGPQMVVIGVSEAEVLLPSTHSGGSACHSFLRVSLLLLFYFS